MKGKIECLLFELKVEQFNISEIMKEGVDTREDAELIVTKFNLIQHFIDKLQGILNSEY